MAGCIILTTKGIATKECAIGINKGNERTSIGGRLKTRMKPRPKVTADVPKGNINIGSRNFPHRDCDEMTFAAKNPKNKAIPIVTRPKYNELKIASTGAT